MIIGDQILLGTVPPRCTGTLLEVAPREFLLGTVPLRELSYRVRPRQIVKRSHLWGRNLLARRLRLQGNSPISPKIGS